MGGTNVKVAVPAAVSCPEPIKFTSEQIFAPVTQKFTVPLVTGVAPASTVAVNVNCAGDTMLPPDATVAPPLDNVNVVVVAACPKAGALPRPRVIAHAVKTSETRRLNFSKVKRTRGEPDIVWKELWKRMVLSLRLNR
jgi:hypothetical protein